MEMKEILNPKRWMIGLGVIVILASLGTIFGAEDVAKQAWGEDNLTGNEAAYEEMWGLHLIPLGAMAIATGLFVKGKALSQMAMMASAAIVVIIGGGMGFMTQRHDYGHRWRGCNYYSISNDATGNPSWSVRLHAQRC